MARGGLQRLLWAVAERLNLQMGAKGRLMSPLQAQYGALEALAYEALNCISRCYCC